MDFLFQDFRYSLRLLVKNPGFAVVAVLTLALGIGANTAIFSVVNGVLLRSLPYPAADRLISLDGGQSRPDLEDFSRQSHTISQLGGFADWSFDLIGKAEPEQVKAALVSLDLFPALGVNAQIGRTFAEQDDLLGGAPIVVLSHRFWMQRLGGDANVIGRSLNLTGKSYTVVGVMPADFLLPRGQAEIFVPMRVGYPEAANERGVHFQYAIGRLAPNASRQQSQAEVNAIGKHLGEMYPGENRDRHFSVVVLQDRVVRNVLRTLLVLLGAVAFVLLIASANFANLLLARASARQAEVQTRLALGATPGRLIRQMLTESVFLGLLAGIVGTAFGFGLLQALLAAKPAQLPSLATVNLDLNVLGFATLVSFLTGLVFGLFPALQAVGLARRASIQQRIAEARQRGSSLFRHALIVSEVALCVMLLCGSGLLIRSLIQLQNVSPGFDSADVLTAQVWLPENRYHSTAPQDRVLQDILDGVQHIPGAQSASLVTELPLSGQHLGHDFLVEGRPPIPVGSEPDAETNLISPGYFETLHIPLLKGRDFKLVDRSGSPLVAIVNESMARQYWPGQDPLGTRIRYARASEVKWMVVVGVVADVKASGLDQPGDPTIYTPIFQKQEEWRRWATIAIRSAGVPPMQLAAAMKQQVWKFDAQLPLVQVQPLSWYLEESLAERRFNTFLLSILAAMALVLAMVGLYGVISYTVSLRTREFGIRVALGAVPSDILGIVLGGAMRMIGTGAVIGLIAAFAVTRILSGFLYQVSSRDPLTFTATTVLLVAVALLATYVPARRATKVDPMVALRYE